MNRRNLLTAAPAAMMLSGAAAVEAGTPAPDPDAGLHAKCTEFHRLHALGYDDGNPDWEAAMAGRWQVFEGIEGMLPHTYAGHRAKATVAVAVLDENRCNGEFVGGPDARFALGVLKGMLERGLV